MKLLTIFGTRPEAIKMCPLVIALGRSATLESRLCVTGQHQAMLDQVLKVFEVVPDYNLEIMQQHQSLTAITTRVLEGLEPILEAEQPELVLVHGDTSTSVAAALAAFYRQIPVGHVEAGLRTYNRYSPFPEEMNRRLLSALATCHFAPTERNRQALAREGITQDVFVTGNTVIDAFQYTIRPDYVFRDPVFRAHDFSRPTILMTAHRRENLGAPLVSICEAVRELCERHPDLRILYPVHLNPAVREPVFSLLGDHEQVSLTSPVDILDMHNAISKSLLVLTDSGGLQEEVPHLGKPVVVLRTNTERPEAIEAGTAILAGVQKERIMDIVESLLTDQERYHKMSTAINPYGDGHASERIVALIERGLPASPSAPA
jgi:UDP-N-acetylglucosamine 2-epimerase (non-hydrolysing)